MSVPERIGMMRAIRLIAGAALLLLVGCSNSGDQMRRPSPTVARFNAIANGLRVGTARVEIGLDGTLTMLEMFYNTGNPMGTIDADGHVAIDVTLPQDDSIVSPFTGDLATPLARAVHVTGTGTLSSRGVGQGTFTRDDGVQGTWTAEPRIDVPLNYVATYFISAQLQLKKDYIEVNIDRDGEMVCNNGYALRGQVDGSGRVDFYVDDIAVSEDSAPETVHFVGRLHPDGTGSGLCTGGYWSMVADYNATP